MKTGLATAATMAADPAQKDGLAAHFDNLSSYLVGYQPAFLRYPALQ
jgi:hypothetical protein